MDGWLAVDWSLKDKQECVAMAVRFLWKRELGRNLNLTNSPAIALTISVRLTIPITQLEWLENQQLDRCGIQIGMVSQMKTA